MLVRIDFETRSAADLKQCGAWKYAEHESTDVLCVVWAAEKSSPRLAIPFTYSNSLTIEVTPWDKFQEEFTKMIANEDILFEAHNAFFERSIWHNIIHKRYGLPDIPKHRWRCSAAMAAAQALPRALGNLAEALGLTEEKDKKGHDVMLQLSKKRKTPRKDEYYYMEQDKNPQKFEKLYQYCVQDVVTERSASETLSPLNEKELQIWLLDQIINERGVTIDMDLVDSAISVFETYSYILDEQIHDITDGAVQKITNVAGLKRWVNIQLNTDYQSLDKNVIRELLKQPLPDDVKTALKLRQQGSKTSVKKYTAMRNSVCADGRIKDVLLYHGASTGRWAGKLVQFQNIPRGFFKTAEELDEAVDLIKRRDWRSLETRYDNVPEVLSSAIRGTIVPSEGKDLYVADYSAIEARVVAWLAGQEDLLELFKAGGDVYLSQAEAIFNMPVNKKDHPYERQVGKTAILAFGYQGGISAMATMCSGYGVSLMTAYDSLADSFTKDEKIKAESSYKNYIEKATDPLAYEEAIVADVIKQRWRIQNHRIAGMWYEVERAAVNAIRSRTGVYTYNKIVFAMVGKSLCCKLPSGRLLYYYDPKLAKTKTPWGEDTVKVTFMAVNSMTRKWERQSTYGGKLVENITQAVARDLIAEGMLNCEIMGYECLLSVHDELVAEAPKGFGSIEEFENLLATTPNWASGCPVTAEGWIGTRYRK